MSDTTARSTSDSNPGNGEAASSSSIIAHTQAPPQASQVTVAVPKGPSVSSTPPAIYDSKARGIGEIMKYVLSFLILGGGFSGMVWLTTLKKDPENQVSKELVPMVATIAAEPYLGELDLVLSGTVVPYREIRVAAEVSGNIITKYPECEAGNFVKKGTKLLDIDPINYELEVKTRVAEVNQAEKMLDETREEIVGVKRNILLAKKDYDLSKSDFLRNERIKNALSSSEFDQSRRNFLNAETSLTGRENNLNMLIARVARLEAAIVLSEAQLDRSKLNLEKTTIVAPVDGVIVREVVQEGDNVTPGAQLVMFEDTSRSEVVCNLASSDLAWIRDNSNEAVEADTPLDNHQFSVYHLPKTNVSIYEPGKPNVPWEGVLERFDGIGRDESTRTIPARITIDNPIISTESGKRALVRGMYVKCRIKVPTVFEGATKSYLSFPTVALRSGDHVWIVRDRELVRVPVDVIDYVEQPQEGILSKMVVVRQKNGSLQLGDLIVTTPLSQPSEGIAVILESDNESSADSDSKTPGSQKKSASADSP